VIIARIGVGNGLQFEGKSVHRGRCEIPETREKPFDIEGYYDPLYLAYLLHIKKLDNSFPKETGK